MLYNKRRQSFWEGIRAPKVDAAALSLMRGLVTSPVHCRGQPHCHAMATLNKVCCQFGWSASDGRVRAICLFSSPSRATAMMVLISQTA